MSSGILLVNKEAGFTSFHLVSMLRKITRVEKIGHCGTLDPFATGLMVMLVGREYTKRSDEFLQCDKEYLATVRLGVSTDTYDTEGNITFQSEKVPTVTEIQEAVELFQGDILQIPPMFSAKKIQGQKLCDLARRGITLERPPVPVHLCIQIVSYSYPELKLHIKCSKGTYIRSLAHDLGEKLSTGAHLSSLTRVRSGPFELKDAIEQSALFTTDLTPHFRVIRGI